MSHAVMASGTYHVCTHVCMQEVTTVIPDLFQGHLSHVTTCHTCNQPSEGSKREVEFYELSLQVQNMPSLHHSMVSTSPGCLSARPSDRQPPAEACWMARMQVVTQKH